MYIVAMMISLMIFMPYAFSEVSSNDESGWRNYILVIDNSGSNVKNLKSTGAATDPEGLRFSACRRMYSEMRPDKSRMGLIVFSGSGDYCMRFDPLELNSSYAKQLIYDRLDDPNVINKRNQYTDINYALMQARDMAHSFRDGETAIILLTDGVNDLTNSDTALTDRENIEQNRLTLETVRSIHDENISFFVIALTAHGHSEFRSLFMKFINQMGEAGGGIVENGALNNVFEALDDGLGDAFSRIRGRQVGELVDEREHLFTPTEEEVQIPDFGVEQAGITISFSVSDRDKLRSISLVDPQNKVYEVWKNGHSTPGLSNMFRVETDKNFVNIQVQHPTAGNWRVIVEGAEGTSVSQIVTLDTNLRINLSVNKPAHKDQPAHFVVRFQEYTSNGYTDCNNESLYTMSQTMLDLTAPSGTTQNIEMKNTGTAFEADVILNEIGTYKVNIQATNPFVDKHISDYALDVVEWVTPTPPPVPVGDISISIAPVVDEENGIHYIAKDADVLELTWDAPGDYDGIYCEIKKDSSLIPDARFENTKEARINIADLSKDIYDVNVRLIPSDGSGERTETIRFAIYPDPSELTGFQLNVDRFNKEQDGVFVVDGHDVNLSWSLESGDATKVILDISDDVGRSEQQVLDWNDQKNGYQLKDLKDNVTTLVRAVPVPKYGISSDGVSYADSVSVTPLVLTPSEKLMRALPMILAIVGGILALTLLFFAIYKLTRKRLTGALGIRVIFNGIPEQITIDLNKVENGSRIGNIKRARKELRDKPYYKSLSSMAVSMTTVGEDGHIVEDTRGRMYIANNKALKIVLGENIMEFTDSSNQSCFFTVDQEGGDPIRFACLFSLDDPYPIPSQEPVGGFGGFSF